MESSEVSIKGVIYRVLTGIAGLLLIDWLSGGDPIWPALGFFTGFLGEVYPWAKRNDRADVGIIYFGAVLYLYPAIAISSLGLALPNLLFGNDGFLTVIVLTGAIPVLFMYSKVNPWLVGAVTLVELATVIYFRKTIWQRLTSKV